MDKTKTLILTLGILFANYASNYAQEAGSAVKVKYISANHVYLDAGRLNGISIGDTVKVIKGGKDAAVLRVVFVADNSANCDILSKNVTIEPGDLVVVPAKTVVEADSLDVQKKRRTRQFKTTVNTKKSKTRISGYISAQWYQFIDANNGLHDFKQPTVRLNFSGRNLWDDSYYIRIKARSRYNERSRTVSTEIPRTEWRNRIYEFSFSYDNRSAAINYRFGRIISNKYSGVGYLDGVQLQHNISENLNWGIFAGTQPEWQYSDFQTSYQKYGTFINYLYGDYATNRLESTLAAAGTYHSGSISREVVFLQNSYNHGRKWNIYQSLELDINRAWRRDKTGEAVSLSGLYINGRYYITDNLNVGLSYDNRKNYYTYELRTLADSLFDDAFRQGGRLSASLRFFKNYRVFANGGVRKSTAKEITYSYSGGFNASNLFDQRITVSSRFSGFSNLYTRGINPSVDISKYFFAGHYLQIGYGNYMYTLKADNASRLNQFVRFNGQLELPLNLFLATDYEYSFGDDSEGHRILAELGYRF